MPLLGMWDIFSEKQWRDLEQKLKKKSYLFYFYLFLLLISPFIYSVYFTPSGINPPRENTVRVHLAPLLFKQIPAMSLFLRNDRDMSISPAANIFCVVNGNGYLVNVSQIKKQLGAVQNYQRFPLMRSCLITFWPPPSPSYEICQHFYYRKRGREGVRKLW